MVLILSFLLVMGRWSERLTSIAGQDGHYYASYGRTTFRTGLWTLANSCRRYKHQHVHMRMSEDYTTTHPMQSHGKPPLNPIAYKLCL